MSTHKRDKKVAARAKHRRKMGVKQEHMTKGMVAIMMNSPMHLHSKTV